MLMIKKTLFLALAFIFAVQTYAQVSISPTSLFIDSQRKFETMLIMNTSDAPQEVKLSFEFAYSQSDEKGNLALVYDDDEEAELHSAADWIRGFPKNFVLEAGQRQIVRITVRAPSNLAPGTYWSRLKTTSSALSQTIGNAAEGAIAANINIEFNQITSIFYKHGNLTTALEMGDISHQLENNQLKVFATFTKSGNSPFLGTMVGKIYDTTGALVKEEKVFVSIYYDGLRRLDIDISDLPAGTYEMDISYESGRKDIPLANIIPAPTVSARGSFTKL